MSDFGSQLGAGRPLGQGSRPPRSAPGLPLSSTAVLNGAHRLLSAAAFIKRDGCDHCDWYEQHRFLRLTRRSVLSGPRPIPTGTTRSADICLVSLHLSMRAAGAATPTAQPTPRQIAPDKNDQFSLRSPRLRDDPVDGDGLCLLEQAHPDRPAFYGLVFPGAGDTLRASFPPTSQRRSCLQLGVSTTSFSRGPSPPNRSPMPGVLGTAPPELAVITGEPPGPG